MSIIHRIHQNFDMEEAKIGRIDWKKAYFKEMFVEMWDAAQLVLPVIRN